MQGLASVGPLHKVAAFTRMGQLHICDWQRHGTRGQCAKGTVCLGRAATAAADGRTSSSSLSLKWYDAEETLTLPVWFLAETAALTHVTPLLSEASALILP